MKVRIDMLHKTITTIEPETPSETLSFETLGWELPEKGTDEFIMLKIKELLKESTEKITNIIMWPATIKLNLVGEEPGLYKKIYRKKGTESYYCLIEFEGEKNWYTCQSPLFEADMPVNEQFAERFAITKRKQKGGIRR